jgi:hypothetical protein
MFARRSEFLVGTPRQFALVALFRPRCVAVALPVGAASVDGFALRGLQRDAQDGPRAVGEQTTQVDIAPFADPT